MSASPVPFVKRGSSKDEDVVVDFTHGGNTPAARIEGRPQKSLPTGRAQDGLARRDSATYRCTRYGDPESWVLPG